MDTNKQPTEYQTGSTKPPKSHGGIIAFFLSATIFLCGLFTILNLLRVNFLQKLNDQTENRVCKASFSAPPADASAEQLGFQGVPIPDFWQDFRQLPEGLFITRAKDGLLLRTGDILLNLNGQPISNWEQVTALAKGSHPGDQFTAIIFREGAKHTIHLTLGR